MPSRLASGANTCSASRATLGGARLLAGGVPAQRLQARRQPQHHHAQVARERQQHLAHVLGLRLRVVHQLAPHPPRRAPAAAPHQLGGFHRQRGVVVAERLGDHLLRLVQVLAGVDQVAGRLHGLGAAHGLEDGGHGVGVGQRVLAGVQRLAGDEGLGERARARQRVGLVRHRLLGRPRSARALARVSLLRGQAFHRRVFGRSRNEATASTWSRSRTWAHGPRLRIPPAAPRAALRHGQRGVLRQQVGLARRAVSSVAALMAS